METHQNSDSGNGLNVDQPIKEAGKDLLGRGDFVRSLATSIRGIKNNEGSFVITLSGAWGSGKTSILNLLKAKLKKPTQSGKTSILNLLKEKLKKTAQSDDKEVVTKEFSCLYTQNEAAMLNRLIDIIQEFFPGESFIFNRKRLAELIPSKEIDVFLIGLGMPPVVTAFQNFFCKKENNPAEEIIKELQETFKKQKNKKFVLFIDDIDRLPPNKVITIFRLVKTLGDMPNLVIVLSYDNEIVSKLVQQEYKAEGEVFMDKMVQAIRSVPPLSQMDKKKLIEKILKEHLPQKDEWRNTEAARHSEAIEIVSDLITTPRDIKRLGNELQLYGPLAKELNREDMLVLQTLQIKKPDIYDFIRTEGHVFFSYTHAYNAGFRELYDPEAPLYTLEDEEKKMSVPAFFEDFEKKLTGEDKQLFRQVMYFLFPVFQRILKGEHAALPDSKRHCRLASEDYFQSFFSLTMSENILPLSDAESLLNAAHNRDELKEFLQNALNRENSSANYFTLVMRELALFPTRDHEKIDAQPIKENVILTLFEIADEILAFYRNKKRDHIYSIKYRVIGSCIRDYVNENHFGSEYSLEKEALLSEAMDIAALNSIVWYWFFADMAFRQHHSSNLNDLTSHQGYWFFTPEKSEQLMAEAIQKFDSKLEYILQNHQREAFHLLEIWSQNGQNDGNIKSSINARWKQDDFAINLAKAFYEVIKYGDYATEQNLLKVKNISRNWLDFDMFKGGLNILIEQNRVSEEDLETIKDFLKIWDMA